VEYNYEQVSCRRGEVPVVAAAEHLPDVAKDINLTYMYEYTLIFRSLLKKVSYWSILQGIKSINNAVM
jgi:hypothetical protein